MDTFTLRPVAYMESCFPTKFGIPRQSGLAPHLQGRIIFEKDYRSADALRGLEDFSHIWLIWSFSENPTDKWNPTVRPPRLGGNKRIGVFASRSPFRPNGLGISCVKIEKIEEDPCLGPVILVSGADLMDGTPIFDIKPYITLDCHPEAVCGFQEKTADYHLSVEDPDGLLAGIPQNLQRGLLEALSQDPRPAYQDDPNRIYGIPFAGFDVHFRTDGYHLVLTQIVKTAQIVKTER